MFEDLFFAIASPARSTKRVSVCQDVKKAPCVLSVAEHAGWAHVVCVAAVDKVPAVVERRRVTLIDPGLPTMPYEHDTAAMKEDEANGLIARVRRSIDARASLALQRLATELAPAHAIVALAIREPQFAGLPKSVAAVRANYRLQCAADGMLYQMAFCRAARRLDLEVYLYRRGEEASRAAEPLKMTAAGIEQFVSRTGRPAGPPWTQDHRRAYAAAIAALSAHTRLVMAGVSARP
jgi:hypothetical protein